MSGYGVRILGLALVIGMTACGRDRSDEPAVPSESAQRKAPASALSSFVYARGKDSLTSDPADATDGETALLLTNVFDTLVRFQVGKSTVEPSLATSWETAPGGLSMTFHLRPGVKFHDGTECDAAAAATSMERQRDEKHPYHFTPGRYPYWGDMFGFVKKITAPDPATVRFEFSEPVPGFFLDLLAMFSSSIVSPASLAKGKEWVARHPVGTGPFRLVSWENQEITLEANPDHWDGRPKLDRLVFVVVTDVRTAFARLETGQVQGIDNVAFRDMERIRKDPRFTLHQVNPGLSVCYLSMNNERPPFTDVRVRKAVALAIDKARIVQAAYEGFAAPATTLLPPSVPGHLAIPDRKRDVAAAKALLAEAGASGAKVSLMFPGNPRPYLPDPDALAAQIRDDLREVGLDVTLQKQEWAVHLPALQNGEHQLGVLGWSPDIADPDNFLYVLLDKDGAVKGSANNVSFYRSEAFHEKVVRARASRDPAERQRLYEDAQRIAFEDVPLVPLVVTPRTAATLSTVKGFVLDPISSPRFAWTSLSK